MLSTKSHEWVRSLRQLYDKALQHYEKGDRDVAHYFTEAECGWLASIGCRPAELYDFAEDYPEIDWETALLVTAVRRDYFLHVMKGHASGKNLEINAFPAKDAELEGIRWLPRIILKAKAKLRGELPDSLMYLCGGDRGFLKKLDIHPADFLRVVWAAGDNDREIVDFVKSRDAGLTAKAG